MDISGSHSIPASPERVFQALNDTDTLAACIPGCQSLERVSEQDLTATIVVKIGAMPAKFNCDVKIADQTFPQSYTIVGGGKAGAAGAAKGTASVTLSPEGDGTLLAYDVKTELEGMLSKFGAGLLDPIAKELSGRFFDALVTRLTEDAEPEPEDAPSPPPQQAPRSALSPNAWLLVAFGVCAAVLAAIVLR